MSRTVPIQPSRQPNDVFHKLSIQGATFKWKASLKTVFDKENKSNEKPLLSLNVENLSIKTNSIVGVTGDDGFSKTSFALALLGQMPLGTGDYRRSGTITYYPERPYMMVNRSIRQNVTFACGNFNESRYRDALATVQLCMSKDFDTVSHSTAIQDKQWLQRISLARALYEERWEKYLKIQNKL